MRADLAIPRLGSVAQSGNTAASSAASKPPSQALDDPGEYGQELGRAPKNTRAGESYSDILGCLGRLYVAAVVCGIPDLQTIVVRKVWATLLHLTLFGNRVAELITFAKTVFPYCTEDRGSLEAWDLKWILVQFFVCWFEEFSIHAEFSHVCAETPEILTAIMQV